MEYLKFDQRERSDLFIDGAMLFITSKRLGFEVDYRSMLDLLRARMTLVRAFYYAVLPPTEEVTPLKP